MSCRKGITDFQWSLRQTVLPLQAHPDPPQVDLASAAAIGVAAAMTAIFRGQCPPCGGCAPPLGHSALPTFMFDWCHESCNSPRGYKATTTFFWWLEHADICCASTMMRVWDWYTVNWSRMSCTCFNLCSGLHGEAFLDLWDALWSKHDVRRVA